MWSALNGVGTATMYACGRGSLGGTRSTCAGSRRRDECRVGLDEGNFPAVDGVDRVRFTSTPMTWCRSGEDRGGRQADVAQPDDRYCFNGIRLEPRVGRRLVFCYFK